MRHLLLLLMLSCAIDCVAKESTNKPSVPSDVADVGRKTLKDMGKADIEYKEVVRKYIDLRNAKKRALLKSYVVSTEKKALKYAKAGKLDTAMLVRKEQASFVEQRWTGTMSELRSFIKKARVEASKK